jgi:hypothetical protein
LSRVSAFVLFAALAAGGHAFADEQTLSPLPPPAPAANSLEEIMRADATCMAFTNECEICTRADAGPQCSTPGMACQPKAWRCGEPVAAK